MPRAPRITEAPAAHRQSFWVRVIVPVIRGLLVLGVTIACWRGIRGVVPRKQTAPEQIRTPPEIPRMRVEYPLALVPGGIGSDDDLEAARAADPLLAAHYADVGFLRPAFLIQDRLFYASYRQGSRIVWTSSPIPVRAGESILGDRSGNLIRGRCGNRLSETPRLPTGFVEPPRSTFETPEISFADDATLPDVAADHLAMAVLPPFPAIEAPALKSLKSKMPEIPVTIAPPAESPLEPWPENVSIFSPGIPPPLPKPQSPRKLPPEQDRIPVPEPGTARMLCAALLGLSIFRGARKVLH